MELTFEDLAYLGLCLGGFFFGLYSGIFTMYLQHHGSRNDADAKTGKMLFYALCVLYVLSLVSLVIDIMEFTIFVQVVQLGTLADTVKLAYQMSLVSSITECFCDFISQSILIYRCWIVWGRDTRVVIIPSILTFAFLATWLASEGALFIQDEQILVTCDWGEILYITSLVASMIVNALATGLIVLRIIKVFQQVKCTQTLTLEATGGSKLRTIIFILIESGMTLFAIQLALTVVSILNYNISSFSPIYGGETITIAVHQQLNGITPTVILVRVSMGLSFHDKESLEESVGSLRFASDPGPKSNSDTESNDSIDDQETWREDGIVN